MTREAKSRVEEIVSRRIDAEKPDVNIEIYQVTERMSSLKRKISYLSGVANRYQNGEETAKRLFTRNLADIQKEIRALDRKMKAVPDKKMEPFSAELQKQMERVEEIIANNQRMLERNS